MRNGLNFPFVRILDSTAAFDVEIKILIINVVVDDFSATILCNIFVSLKNFIKVFTKDK